MGLSFEWKEGAHGLRDAEGRSGEDVRTRGAKEGEDPLGGRREEFYDQWRTYLAIIKRCIVAGGSTFAGGVLRQALLAW